MYYVTGYIIFEIVLRNSRVRRVMGFLTIEKKFVDSLTHEHKH